MKSYTDIEQSKKLAEILPLESADMCFKCFGEETYDLTFCEVSYSEWAKEYKEVFDKAGLQLIPCWSLATLLGILPNENMLVKTTDGEYYCLAKDAMTKHYDNSVDACYEMILKLHELKML